MSTILGCECHEVDGQHAAWCPAHPANNKKTAPAVAPSAEVMERAPDGYKPVSTNDYCRLWLQEHFPTGNHGFWNWQTVESFTALVTRERNAARLAALEQAATVQCRGWTEESLREAIRALAAGKEQP